MGDPRPYVRVTDVTLREFGQNVQADRLEHFTPEIRVRAAKGLMAAGVPSLEVFSCVHPKVAPAMSREAITLVADGLGRSAGADLVTLVPNRAGYKTFLELGLGPDGHGHVMGLFLSAVEAHNLANLGRTVAETLEAYQEVARDATSRGIPINGYVSGVFGYRARPGEELLLPSVEGVNALVDRFFDMGARTVALSDLQGVADERSTKAFLEQILEARKGRDLERLGYHPHHVSGERAVDNSLAVLALGIRRFDGSLGGTGGCVTGAPGNQPTELLVRRLHEAGAVTGIDENRLNELGAWMEQDVYSQGRP